MRIHQYEKLWLAASFVLILGFIATVTYGAVGLGITMVDDREETIDPTALDDHPKFGDPGVYELEDGQVEAYVIARQFIFVPDPIVIPAEREVTFYITSPDVIHGLGVVGTNVNTMVIPGEVAVLTVQFDEPGEYGIVCNEYCGAGHHGMEGILQVVPADEWEGDE